MKAQKNDWVLTHTVVLTPDKRAAQIPEDTRAVPLEMWVKGYLTDDEAEIGDEVTVRTRTGRTVSGTLTEISPRYTHDFGEFVPELLRVGDDVRAILFGGDEQ